MISVVFQRAWMMPMRRLEPVWCQEECGPRQRVLKLLLWSDVRVERCIHVHGGVEDGPS